MRLLLIVIACIGLIACSIVPTDKRTIELPTNQYRVTEDTLAAKRAIAAFKAACTERGWLLIDNRRFTCYPED